MLNHQLTSLPVSALEVCDRTRVRANKPKDSSDIVIEYAEAYRCGLITEPLDVFREKGTERYIVADGENRLLALRRAKIKEVECRLYEGDEIDALDFATRCNQKHGLRRTKADIYHAFTRIMETPQLRKKYNTDTELSIQLGVSVATITRYKVDWRNSEGGDARVRAKKAEARESAEKRTASATKTRKAMSSTDDIQDDDLEGEIQSETRKIDIPSERPSPPEPAAPAPRMPTAKDQPSLSSALVMNLRRGIALIADIPREANLRGIDLNRAQVEHVHALLGAFLEG